MKSHAYTNLPWDQSLRALSEQSWHQQKSLKAKVIFSTGLVGNFLKMINIST